MKKTGEKTEFAVQQAIAAFTGVMEIPRFSADIPIWVPLGLGALSTIGVLIVENESLAEVALSQLAASMTNNVAERVAEMKLGGGEKVAGATVPKELADVIRSFATELKSLRDKLEAIEGRI